MEPSRLWMLPKPLFSPQQSALLKGGGRKGLVCILKRIISLCLVIVIKIEKKHTHNTELSPSSARDLSEYWIVELRRITYEEDYI